MRKILDQNGRLFGLISIIDVIVILAVCVLAVALMVREEKLSPSSQSGTASVPVTYELKISNLNNALVENIQVGDKMYDHDQSTNGNIGTIVDVEVTPAVRVARLTDGTITTASAEDRSDLIITVEGTCAIVDGRYRFNNVYELGVNANRNFYTPFAYFTGVVLSIV